MSASTPGNLADISRDDPELKRQARELFRGLPRRYDLLSAVLSFGRIPAGGGRL